MNAIARFPLSPLEQSRKDEKATTLRHAVEDIFSDPDRRWTDAELLSIHLSCADLKKFLMGLSK